MGSCTAEIISAFEEEQKSTVFSALSEYLSSGEKNPPTVKI